MSSNVFSEPDAGPLHADEGTGAWFAVLCIGRSGSTYLTRLLDSHGRIACLGEAFGPNDAPPAYEATAGVSRREWLLQTLGSRDVAARGFKLPIEALLNRPGLLDDLEALGARIVLLKRINRLAHFVSMKLAQETGVWDSQAEYPSQRLVLDPWQLYAHVIGVGIQESLLDKSSAGFPRFQIAYEDLSNQARLAELQAFLGVTPFPLHSSTVQGRTAPLRQVIENVDDILRVLEPTPLAPALRTWLAQDEGQAQVVVGGADHATAPAEDRSASR